MGGTVPGASAYAARTALTPRTSVVMIYHGDDLELLARLHLAASLEERREEAGQSTPLRVGDAVAEVRTAREAYDEAVEEAAERAVAVRLTALGRKAFRALLADHAPREGNKGDNEVGYNQETFPEAFLLESVTEPEMSRTSLGTFLDGLAEGDFDKLFMTAYMMNRAASRDPKDSTFFADSQSSDATSA